MFNFVEELTTGEKIYFYIAFAGTLFFIFQTLFTFLDLGEHFELDADYDGTVDFNWAGLGLPFNLFSFRGIIGFFMVFGWSGLVFSQSELQPFIAFLLAFACGFVMMVIIGAIYYFAIKLGEDGTIEIKNAIGRECEVYLRIPEHNSGLGKVHITLNGSLREIDAITNDELIDSGEVVVVVDVVNDKLLVKKINK